MELTSAGESNRRAPPDTTLSAQSVAFGSKASIETLAIDHNPLLLAAALEARAKQIAAMEALLDAGLLSCCLV